MKNHEWLRRCAGNLRSDLKLKSTILGLMSAILVGASGCDFTGCTDGPEPIRHCNTFVTVLQDSCWNSGYNFAWLRTDQGELLQPVSSSVIMPELQQGMRLKIAYEVTSENPENTLLCAYFAPVETPSKAISITCLEPLGVPTCGTGNGTAGSCDIMATAEAVVCGSGVWYNMWLRLDDGTLLQPWECPVQGIQLVNGQRYKIGYDLMQRDNRYQNAVICQAVPPVAEAARITCIEADLTNSITDK